MFHSLEELLQIDVTTVSRESERRIDAPASPERKRSKRPTNARNTHAVTSPTPGSSISLLTRPSPFVASRSRASAASTAARALGSCSLPVLATRSFLVDVHLLDPRR